MLKYVTALFKLMFLERFNNHCQLICDKTNSTRLGYNKSSVNVILC